MGYDNAPSGEMVTHKAHGAPVGGSGVEQEDLSDGDWEAEGNPMVTQSAMPTANAKIPTKPLPIHTA